MTNTLGPIEDATPLQSWLHRNGEEMVVIYLHNDHYHVVYQCTFKCMSIDEANGIAELAMTAISFAGRSDILHQPNDWEDVTEQLPVNVDLQPITGSEPNGKT